MHPRFEAYRGTSLGKTIERLAHQPERVVEYALLSRLDMPAVIALSWDVGPLLLGLSEPDRRDAKQFCGAIVGDVMREHGYEIVNPRGSAQAGGVFTYGAIWGVVSGDNKRTMRIAAEIADEYRETLKSLAK
jgi:hypothetical protein